MIPYADLTLREKAFMKDCYPEHEREEMPPLEDLRHPMLKEMVEAVMEIIRERWGISIHWNKGIDDQIYKALEKIREDWEG